ncbi:hypothetical protein [Streptacidiphilus rugosus]|uniref:hypothetical protein n=1 Tax=Streptacidiphilus rugosus TaxID=405783 RepID=UPI000562E034|nr:hypothetical protein [Streptacidiphilus rugosus]
MSQPTQRSTPVVPLARAPYPLGTPPDHYRVQALHACQVLAGLLMRLPRPESVQLFTAPHWSSPWLQVHLHPDPDDAQMAEYQRVFGGEVTRRWRDGTEPDPDGDQAGVVYSELATVVERVRVQVWNVNDVQAALRQAVPEPTTVPDPPAVPDEPPEASAPQEPAAEAGAEVETAAEPDPVAETETERGTKAETGTEADVDLETETETVAESEAKADTKAEPDPEPEADPGPAGEPGESPAPAAPAAPAAKAAKAGLPAQGGKSK